LALPQTGNPGKSQEFSLRESAFLKFMTFIAERWRIMVLLILMAAKTGFAFGNFPHVRGMAVIAGDP
jgi:hypothetical protein